MLQNCRSHQDLLAAANMAKVKKQYCDQQQDENVDPNGLMGPVDDTNNDELLPSQNNLKLKRNESQPATNRLQANEGGLDCGKKKQIQCQNKQKRNEVKIDKIDPDRSNLMLNHQSSQVLNPYKRNDQFNSTRDTEGPPSHPHQASAYFALDDFQISINKQQDLPQNSLPHTENLNFENQNQNRNEFANQSIPNFGYGTLPQQPVQPVQNNSSDLGSTAPLVQTKIFDSQNFGTQVSQMLKIDPEIPQSNNSTQKFSTLPRKSAWQVMHDRMYMTVQRPQHDQTAKDVRCLSCSEKIEEVLFQSKKGQILPANCKFCGNFIMVKKVNNTNEVRIISQGIKDNKTMAFQPDLQPKKVLQATYQDTHPIRCVYQPYSKFVKYRKNNIKQLFYASECFGFKADTVHLAVQIYDKVLGHREQYIDHLRSTYESCKGVISEQICTFIAAVSLFISSKYLEIKYPMIEDVCKLMECPFTFNEFVEMELVIFHLFEWNMQIPTIVEIIQTILAQGAIFESDALIVPKNQDNTAVSSSSPDKYCRLNFSEITPSEQLKYIQKISKLWSRIANQIICDAQLFIQTPPLHLAIAVILEARRAVSLYPTAAASEIDGSQNLMMPLEMEMMIFGADFHSQPQRDQIRGEILKVWNQVKQYRLKDLKGIQSYKIQNSASKGQPASPDAVQEDHVKGQQSAEAGCAQPEDAAPQRQSMDMLPQRPIVAPSAVVPTAQVESEPKYQHSYSKSVQIKAQEIEKCKIRPQNLIFVSSQSLSQKSTTAKSEKQSQKLNEKENQTLQANINIKVSSLQIQIDSMDLKSESREPIGPLARALNTDNGQLHQQLSQNIDIDPFDQDDETNLRNQGLASNYATIDQGFNHPNRPSAISIGSNAAKMCNSNKPPLKSGVTSPKLIQYISDFNKSGASGGESARDQQLRNPESQLACTQITFVPQISRLKSALDLKLNINIKGEQSSGPKQQVERANLNNFATQQIRSQSKGSNKSNNDSAGIAGRYDHIRPRISSFRAGGAGGRKLGSSSAIRPAGGAPEQFMKQNGQGERQQQVGHKQSHQGGSIIQTIASESMKQSALQRALKTINGDYSQNYSQSSRPSPSVLGNESGPKQTSKATTKLSSQLQTICRLQQRQPSTCKSRNQTSSIFATKNPQTGQQRQNQNTQHQVQTMYEQAKQSMGITVEQTRANQDTFVLQSSARFNMSNNKNDKQAKKKQSVIGSKQEANKALISIRDKLKGPRASAGGASVNQMQNKSSGKNIAGAAVKNAQTSCKRANSSLVRSQKSSQRSSLSLRQASMNEHVDSGRLQGRLCGQLTSRLSSRPINCSQLNLHKLITATNTAAQNYQSSSNLLPPKSSRNIIKVPVKPSQLAKGSTQLTQNWNQQSSAAAESYKGPKRSTSRNGMAANSSIGHRSMASIKRPAQGPPIENANIGGHADAEQKKIPNSQSLQAGGMAQQNSSGSKAPENDVQVVTALKYATVAQTQGLPPRNLKISKQQSVKNLHIKHQFNLGLDRNALEIKKADNWQAHGGMQTTRNAKPPIIPMAQLRMNIGQMGQAKQCRARQPSVSKKTSTIQTRNEISRGMNSRRNSVTPKQLLNQ